MMSHVGGSLVANAMVRWSEVKCLILRCHWSNSCCMHITFSIGLLPLFFHSIVLQSSTQLTMMVTCKCGMTVSHHPHRMQIE